MAIDPIDISEEMTTFKEKLLDKGYKSTPQRDELVKWMFTSHEHFTADDVTEYFRSKGNKVSTATVYRVINLLLEFGLLIQHDFGKGAKYFEHILGHEHHDHLICINCDQIIEFVDNGIEKLQERICKKHGFKIKSHSLKIFVECTKKNCEYRSKD